MRWALRALKMADKMSALPATALPFESAPHRIAWHSRLHLLAPSARRYPVLPPLRVFWWNAARYVRRHKLLALANVLGIALGIAVYLAIRIANESANRAFEDSVDLVAGRAHLEIRGDVDETLWPEIARQPD